MAISPTYPPTGTPGGVRDDTRGGAPALQSWLARARRLGAGAATSGVIWLVAGLVCAGLASAVRWMDVPLIQPYSGWALPIKLGWGAWISYGLLSALVAVVFAIRAVGLLRRPLAAGELRLLGWLCMAPSLLFAFQFLFADFRYVSTLARQESQYLSLLNYLGYKLPTQMLNMSAYQIDISSPEGRLALLAQLINPGALLPLIGGILVLIGARVVRLRGATPLATDTPVRRSPWRKVIWLGAGILALVLLGRAPLGLYFESRGSAALDRGSYATALANFARAETLDPGLAAMSDFRQERGRALYVLGHRDDLDVGLYLAAQARALGGLDQAELVYKDLSSRYGADPVLRDDEAQTLEQIALQNIRPVLIPASDEAPAQDPQIAAQTDRSDRALPALDALVQLEPDSVFARYMRGRVIFAQRAYEQAAQDFHAATRLARDPEMASTAYTYLAFCDIGLGNYADARVLLTKAEKLDDGYFNSTAREAASGLH